MRPAYLKMRLAQLRRAQGLLRGWLRYGASPEMRARLVGIGHEMALTAGLLERARNYHATPYRRRGVE